MVSVQEFWIILGLTAVIALLLGAGAAYFLLPKQETAEDPSPKPKKKEDQKSNERIRRMYALITDLTVTLNYSRVLEKSLDAAFLALRISDMPTDRLISAVLLFSEEEMAVPDLVGRLRPGFAPSGSGHPCAGRRRSVGAGDRNRRSPVTNEPGSRSGTKTIHFFPGLSIRLWHSAAGRVGYFWRDPIWPSGRRLFHR